MSHPAVSTITLHAYPAVGNAHTEVYHPVVCTLMFYTYPAVGIDPADITWTLENDADTTDKQTARLVHPPHHIHPPVAPLSLHAAAIAAGQAVVIVATTAGGDELNIGGAIIAVDSVMLLMID